MHEGPSARVHQEWLRRVEAEYRSAAIVQQLTHWLLVSGAPQDLIEAGMQIASEELEHARLSFELCAMVDDTPPAVDRGSLRLHERSVAEIKLDLVGIVLRFGCVGETVAVPLFRMLRSHATQVPAVRVLDQILRDEGGHRSFAWSVLDWLLEGVDAAEVRDEIARVLPNAFRELDAAYGSADGDALLDEDRAWGLATPAEYSEVVTATVDRVIVPELRARALTTPPEGPQGTDLRF